MWVLFAALSAALLLTCIWQRIQYVAHAATLLEQMDITNFSVLDQEFIRIYDSNISGKVLSKALIESGVGLESLGRKQDTLEDYFFQLTEEGK